MTHDTFNALLEERIAKIRSVLAKKSEEYATADRLHNFKVAAELKKENPAESLIGMLVKHWVPLWTSCRITEFGNPAKRS